MILGTVVTSKRSKLQESTLDVMDGHKTAKYTVVATCTSNDDNDFGTVHGKNG